MSGENRLGEMEAPIFTPETADALLVASARRRALWHITYASQTDDGSAIAWESCLSYAETLMTMASERFRDEYERIVLAVQRDGHFRSRELWRLCSNEAREQGRLGHPPPIVDVEQWGL